MQNLVSAKAMARRYSSVFLITISFAALLQTSTAQKKHTVGDAVGWTIPPDGSTTYNKWAASRTFVLGDILVFDFINGVHDVSEVTKTDYESCNSNNPIRRITGSPASIILNMTGEHHYICGFLGHCDAGQKLAIEVVAALPPSLPSSPPPSPPPPPPLLPFHPSRHHRRGRDRAASPKRSPMTFTVGDEMGWTIPPNDTAYETWATGKLFMVGDVLVFNYRNGSHDVADVTSQSFESCTTAAPLSHFMTPPTKITLTNAGPRFFICTAPGHCSLGQRLAINVADSSGALPPSSALPPFSSAKEAAAAAAADPPPSSSAVRLGGLGPVGVAWLAGSVVGLLVV